MHTHYDTLQIQRNASDDVVKGAYRYLSQKWHPDKNPGGNRAEAERVTKEINAAYRVLSDRAERQKYDQWLAGQEQEQEAQSRAKPSESTASTDSNSRTTAQTELSQGLRLKMAKSIAANRWPLAILGAFIGTSVLFGVALGIDAFKTWADAHAVWMLLIVLGVISSWASSIVDSRVKTVLASHSDDELKLVYDEHSRRKTVVAICATLLVVGGVIAAVLAAKEGGPQGGTDSDNQATEKEIVVRNDCDVPVKFALIFGESSERVLNWSLDPKATTRLVRKDDESFKVPTASSYFYASSQDGRFEWQATRADFSQATFNGGIRNFQHIIDTPDSDTMRVNLQCDDRLQKDR